jgi:excisionase family DNA binding protein
VATETGQDMVKASSAAKKLGVHPRTVKRAIASGQIPGTRIGAVYLVNAAWLANVTSWMPQQEAVA